MPMKMYKFNCDVWVRGESAKDAQDELHAEIKSLVEADNNLIALESDDGIESPDWVEGESK